MSVKIRLRRMGAKSQPSYRVVVTDSRNARDGRFIETIGYYNPRRATADIRFDEEKAMAWLRKGATPSDTARSLLKKGGLWTRFTQGGIRSEEQRRAEAARKERASTRRAERRARAKTAPKAGGRPLAAKSAGAPKSPRTKKAGKAPAPKDSSS